MGRIWECKIGGDVANLPDGADAPMREAVKQAFKELTGKDVEFCFSGWGSSLSDVECEVVNRPL